MKGDIRVTTVQYNLHQGALIVAIEEGTKDEDGFLPTRQLGNVTVTGEDYEEFLAVVKPLRKFLAEKVAKAMSQPAQLQQPQGR